MTVPVIYSSTALTIASDANYNAQADAYDGTPVVVEPSAGNLTQGLMRPGRQIPAQHFNWLTGQFAQIMTQLITDTAVQDGRLDADEAELALHDGRLDVVEDWIANHSPRIKIYEFLSTGDFIIPPRCVAAFGYGCGGGGAGGNGAQGNLTTDMWRAGGAGGGAALASFQPLRGIVPGQTLHVVVGPGGVAAVPLGATGGDGGDSTITRSGVTYAAWKGAQGGRGSVGGHLGPGGVHMTLGGLPVAGTPVMIIGPASYGIRYNSLIAPWNAASFSVPNQPGQGGWGNATGSGASGSYNPTGNFLPGAGGAKGLDGDTDTGVYLGTNPTRRGGGGGGGGAAGPFGPGANGGAGQVGHAVQAGDVNWTDGGVAGANTGAGGGGGGSGGYEDNITNVGGNNDNVAGNGGSGRVYIITVEEQ